MSTMAQNTRLVLKFIVVGGSVAGLATAYALKKAGHDVSLVDASDGNPSITTAALTVPNATKILQQWGLSHLLENVAESADCLQFLDGETGHEITTATTSLESLKSDAAAEFISLPDKELRAALYELAKKEGVLVRFNTQAVHVEPYSGIVTLADGEQISADLIIGADGFYSFIRKCVVENEDEEAEEANGTKKAVFFAFSFPLEKLRLDETLRSLSKSGLWTCWLGDGFIVQGGLAEHERVYSLTLELVYDGVITSADKHWREVDHSELGRFGIDFEKMEDRLRKLIKSSNRTFLKVFTKKSPTDSVVCPRSRCILVGDAAHSLTPGNLYTTGLDLEDAHILSTLFSRIQDPSQIGRFTTAYDDIRQPRTVSLFKFIETRRTAFMAPEGPLRDIRDAALTKLRDLEAEDDDDGVNEGVYFVIQDANDMVEDWWSKYGSSLALGVPPERRYSGLSNLEISVAKNTRAE